MDIDFGQDAPGLLRAFVATAAGGAVLALALHFGLPHIGLAQAGAALAGAVALYAAGMAALMRWDSRITKVRTRDRLLSLVPWRGDEQVLDLGCGRGLWLVGVAARLPRGQVTGIDLWRAEDQSGNSAEAALANASLAGVASRVTVTSGDMRDLPFPDASFDAVVSGWAVHNVEPATERRRALAEAARVLRPGGWLILSDITCRAEYMEALPALGLTGLTVEEDLPGDALRGLASFGSYRPFAIVARRG